MTSQEIKRILRESIKYCKTHGVTGKNFILDKYYVSFSFRPKKEFCKECGRTLD